MAICPHCNQDALGFFAGHLKWRDAPVKCPNGGGLSYRDRSGIPGQHLIAGLIAGLMFLWWLLLIFSTKSWWSIFAPVLVLVMIYISHVVMVSR